VRRALSWDVQAIQSLRQEVHWCPRVPLRGFYFRRTLVNGSRTWTETLGRVSASLPRLRCQCCPATHEVGQADLVRFRTNSRHIFGLGNTHLWHTTYSYKFWLLNPVWLWTRKLLVNQIPFEGQLPKYWKKKCQKIDHRILVSGVSLSAHTNNKAALLLLQGDCYPYNYVSLSVLYYPYK